MTWYKKILIEKRAEVFLGTAVTLLFSLVTLVYHFATGQSFHWEAIDPIEMPGLMPTIVYSALVFVGPGRWLLKMGFYKSLYSSFKGTKGGWWAYLRAKRKIWVFMMLMMGVVVIPWAVNVLNAILSFFYNVAGLMLYLVPPLGITLIIFATFFLVRKNYALQPIPERSDPA